MTSSDKIAPTATYRIQLTKDFTFWNVIEIADYLAALNISHIYLSPILEAVPGSPHGYDVLDFTRVSEERGGEDGLRALDAKLRQMPRPLKLIIDIVPNHMAANPQNPFWRDVLANGRASQYWGLFDMRVADGEKIHLPVLGSDLDQALSKGEIKLGEDAKGQPALCYFDKNFPLSPQSLAALSDKPDISQLLEAQNYKLVSWTETFEKVSYRRFFDITDLIGVRVEDDANYQLTHSKIFQLMRELPSIDGLRVDHVDGLADPGAYLKKLSQDVAPVWIEKILGFEEENPADWAVAGTTGYEFIPHLNEVFIHPGHFESIRKWWVKSIDSRWNEFVDCVHDSKAGAIKTLFPSELERLVALTASNESEHDLARTFWSGITVALSVYRTYYAGNNLSETDRKRIDAASALAKKMFGQTYADAETRFLPGLLSPQTADQKQAAKEWQQLSGPAMAKGLEDTAHYRYTPLAALNEVGCEARLHADPDENFFSWLQRRSSTTPLALNATSTHDTKRSEDCRHRLYAVADLPQAWMDFFHAVQKISIPLKSVIHGSPVPDDATEYFLCQAFVASWPMSGKPDHGYVERLQNYMRKAIKESRGQTSWLKPDQGYEDAINDFVAALASNAFFIDTVNAFMQKISWAGAINSLAVQTIKILSPGTPDFYQGSEMWDFSLVDPDNRRPVPFANHAAAQEEIRRAEPQSDRLALLRHLTATWQSGAIKLWLTKTLLSLRQEFLLPGDHLTLARLPLQGHGADHALAYSIGSDDTGLIVIVPRFPAALVTDTPSGLYIPSANWRQTALDASRFSGKYAVNRLTGGEIHPSSKMKLDETLNEFPVAVLSYSS